MRQAFERIYREHRQGLYTLALSIAGLPDRAEDAVHDAFARLLAMKSSPAGDAVAYAFAAVRNAAVDQRRRAAAQPEPLSELIYEHVAADAVDADHELPAVVREAIDELPEDQAEVMLLKVYAGLTFEQIAEALGAPMGTVASRYRRSLEKLREKLVSAGVAE